MKLFVDDIRACPKGWQVARTVSEAIRYLATQDVEEVSLDHDIINQCQHKPSQPFSMETFMPVAYYIKALQEIDLLQPIKAFPTGQPPKSFTPKKIRIHTSNFIAGTKMAELVGVKDYHGYLYNPRDYTEDGSVEEVFDAPQPDPWCHKCDKNVAKVQKLWCQMCDSCYAKLLDRDTPAP